MLKPYIDMNTKLRQEAKKYFEKDFFKLVKNAVLGKIMETAKKHNKSIKLVTAETRRNYLVPGPNYYTKKFFIENLLTKEMRKTQILMIKPVCLGLSVLELSKTVMHEFWYDYVKQKYDENTKLCYMFVSFIVHLKKMILTKDIAEDVQIRFDTSNFDFSIRQTIA